MIIEKSETKMREFLYTLPEELKSYYYEGIMDVMYQYQKGIDQYCESLSISDPAKDQDFCDKVRIHYKNINFETKVVTIDRLIDIIPLPLLQRVYRFMVNKLKKYDLNLIKNKLSS